MENLQIFKNEQFGEIRTVEINGEPHFVASDVAKALGYKNVPDVIGRHCRWVVKHDIPHPQNKNKTLEVNCIPIGDLFRLGASSELPGARQFESWIYDEVLPTLHKTGTYEMPKQKPKKEKLPSVNMMVKNIKGALHDAGVEPKFIAAEVVRLYSDAGYPVKVPVISDVPVLWDCTTIAKKLGIFSESGRPHEKAISAIIQKIPVAESEMVKTAYSRNGHDGVTVQYQDSVFQKIKQWLADNGYPQLIEYKLSTGNINKCKVVYKEVA